jgi:hypothetical protein
LTRSRNLLGDFVTHLGTKDKKAVATGVFNGRCIAKDMQGDGIAGFLPRKAGIERGTYFKRSGDHDIEGWGVYGGLTWGNPFRRLIGIEASPNKGNFLRRR